MIATPTTSPPRTDRPVGPRPARRRRAPAGLALAIASLLSIACGEYGGGSGGGASGASATGSSNRSAGTTQQDDAVQAFAQTVHPLTVQYCAECHSGRGPGSPSIADPDPLLAYAAVTNNQKANLGNPPASRLAARLALDLHYCWSSCSDDAALMTSAIAQWANLIGFANNNTVLPNAIRSGESALGDGIELDPSSARYRENLIALWEFKEGSGTVAFDTSGVEPAIDLELARTPTWMSNFGLDFEDGFAIANRTVSRKLYDQLADPVTGTQQYSVELWSQAANISQEGPARIISYHVNNNNRNFELGQVLYTYDFRNRLAGGEPTSLRTYDVDRDLQAVLQHVVITYDQYRGRRIYVNGEFTDDVDEERKGRLYDWNPDYRLAFGNTANGDRQWIGKLRYAAIYRDVMSDAAIVQNYIAGVGKKVIVRFDTSAFTGPGSYIEFVVSEYDEFSYMFCEPTFRANNPAGTRVAGLRIAVNGQVPVAGQAFTSVDSAAFALPARLSRQCSLIRKDLGPDLDRFSIDFEILEAFEHVEQVNYPAPGIDTTVNDPLPEAGFRDSARVNATMATITRVDASLPAVRNVYTGLAEQLPATPDLRSFVASNQVGISKLALEYCDALVEDPLLREDFFGPFPFDQAPASALDATGRDQIIDALYTHAIGTDLASQPEYADPGPGEPGVRSVLDALATSLIASCDAQSPCDAVRTRTIVKGMCTAVLASGATHIQ